MYKVVLIDDNKTLADSLASFDLWEKAGCRVVSVCYDSASGCDAILREKPHLIVSDIRMPGMDGLEIIRMVKAEVPHSRVIFISAYDDFSYAQRALRLGAQDYLLKPFSREAITRSVSEAVQALSTDASAAEPDNSDDVPLMKPILQYLSDHIDRQVTAEEVARIFYMSTSRLNALIRKYNGKCFRDIRCEIRMNRAKEMLNDVRYSINDIARKVGFQSYASFYRAFIREFDISPTDYRDAMQHPYGEQP